MRRSIAEYRSRCVIELLQKLFNLACRQSRRSAQCRPDTSFSDITDSATDSFTFLCGLTCWRQPEISELCLSFSPISPFYGTLDGTYTSRLTLCRSRQTYLYRISARIYFAANGEGGKYVCALRLFPGPYKY